MTTVTEAVVEQSALEWLVTLGWSVAHGPYIAPTTPNTEHRDSLLPRLVDKAFLRDPRAITPTDVLIHEV